MNIGLTEIILILIIAVCVIRPENSGKYVSGLIKDLWTLKDVYLTAVGEARVMADDLKKYADGALNDHEESVAEAEETDENTKGGDTCI